MDQQLTKQTPSVITNFPKEGLFDLPPLVFDGIPTSVNEMTQAQLRAFIPTILKFSTGRGKPGWGKDELRPEWWPVDLPWKNVRSDCRTDEAKKAMAWSECLRKIVISCYLHHNRGDLLNMSSSNKAPANQQQQQEMMLSNMMPNSNVPTLTDVSSTQVRYHHVTCTVASINCLVLNRRIASRYSLSTLASATATPLVCPPWPTPP